MVSDTAAVAHWQTRETTSDAATGDVGITEHPLRGYEVTLLIRNARDNRYLQGPIKLPEGITAMIDGRDVVLTVPVRANNVRRQRSLRLARW